MSKHWLMDHRVICAMLRHTNAYRMRYGLRPLTPDLELSLAAQRWAVWMSRNSYTHSPRSLDWPWMECIHCGPQSALACIQGWMNSRSHRSILLTGQHIGFGYMRSRNHSTWWVAEVK